MFGKVAEEVRKRGARRVLLQVPEGLKASAQGIAEEIEEAGAEAFISVERCYGACDVRECDAKRLGCDLIVHVGHADFGMKTEIPVVYEEWREDFDPVPVLKASWEKLKGFGNVALVSTVQHLGSLERAREFLEAEGKSVHVGVPTGPAKHPGQILGCDYSAAVPLEPVADCFIYIGSGRFHPVGLAERVKKPVFSLNPEAGTLERIERDRNREVVRLMRIEKAKAAERFGILVSSKPGQARPGLAEKIKEKLKGAGKKAWILAADEFSPDKLMGIDMDVLVNTACPRIWDDVSLFGKNVINAEDVDEVAGGGKD